MKKILIAVIIVFLTNICTGKDSCECKICWEELERVEHMYE